MFLIFHELGPELIINGNYSLIHTMAKLDMSPKVFESCTNVRFGMFRPESFNHLSAAFITKRNVIANS